MTVDSSAIWVIVRAKGPHWFDSTGDEPAEILSIFERPGERMIVRTPPRSLSGLRERLRALRVP